MSRPLEQGDRYIDQKEREGMSFKERLDLSEDDMALLKHEWVTEGHEPTQLVPSIYRKFYRAGLVNNKNYIPIMGILELSPLDLQRPRMRYRGPKFGPVGIEKLETVIGNILNAARSRAR